MCACNNTKTMTAGSSSLTSELHRKLAALKPLHYILCIEDADERDSDLINAAAAASDGTIALSDIPGAVDEKYTRVESLRVVGRKDVVARLVGGLDGVDALDAFRMMSGEYIGRPVFSGGNAETILRFILPEDC